MAQQFRQRSFAGFEDEPVAGPSPETQPAETPPAEATPERVAESPAPCGDPPTVYLVDAYSLIFQVFHAMPQMSSPSGQPVAAVHGFLRDILDLIENRQPDYLFCAFDAPGATFRHEKYEPYKAEREEMPIDLRPQIEDIRRVLQGLGVPVLEQSGYEADDILATLARRADELGWHCYVVTGDKDCRQLITDRVRLFNIRKNAVYDAAALWDEWGVRPDQVVDFQALVGDKIDNVPGIPLIGPKIARELLQRYHTLEGVLDHAGEVAGAKRRENLLAGRAAAMLSRELVRLVDDLPLEIDWESGRVCRFDPQPVLPLCQEFGFRRMAERLSALGGSRQAAPPPPLRQADYHAVSTLQQLSALATEMARQTSISVDTETTSTNPCWAEIVGYSFAWKPGEAYYVPVRAPEGDPQLDPDQVREILGPVLENPQIEKVGQNLKYDMIVLRSTGIQLQGLAFDTMVADYLIDPGERNHGIDDLARRYLDHNTIKIEQLIGTGKKQKCMDQVPVELVTPYAAEDADLPLQLRPLLERRLEEQQLTGLFRNLEMPLIQVLAAMESHGIRVDAGRLAELGQRFAERMAGLEQEIFELAGGAFNIDSRLQLAKILFEQLQLPISKRTKTGPSTDVEVLTELAGRHPLPAKIVEYRQYAKLKSTYVDSLAQLVNPRTGRVHTSFKQDVAATGRLSSQEPNLQNIPIRTREGREIRSAFLPGQPGWKLLTADYSQIELRVLAHFCDDEALRRAFAEDRDIHAAVAAEVNGVPLAEVTPEMRRSAKAVNFGVIYGQSAFGLAKSLGIDKQDAARFIEAYFARYPGVDQFMENTLAECRQKGYVSTILGRRRAVQGVRDPSSISDSRQRNLPERIAINTVIQGSAADLIKQAMINVSRRLDRERSAARMLLQIHDELIFEAPSAEIDRLAQLVREEMTSVGSLDVPLKVDVKAGDNWAECEAWD